MPALDYFRVFDVYDAYCRFDGDVPYFASKQYEGEVLELMAGTGRVSIPLIRAGVRLTCLDSDAPMLTMLARKEKGARIVCGDVCRLPLRGPYRAVLLPFQGLSELVDPNDRAILFAEVSRVLEDGGVFVCTTHNPVVRVRSLDGAWHTAGAFRDDDGRVVEVSVRGTHDGGVVTGEQRVIVRNACGSAVRDHLLPLRFALPSLEEIQAHAARSGLRLISVHGSYDGAPYKANSPAIIASCQKRS